MKGGILGLVLVLSLISPVWGSFDPSAIANLEPFCGLHGITVTKDNYFSTLSDTSGWRIPKAYDGECRDYPMLNEKEAKRIYTIMYYVLKENQGAYKYIDGEARSERTQEFLQEGLFGALQEALQREHKKGKEDADLEKMAKIHFVARLVGYDYSLVSWESLSQ